MADQTTTYSPNEDLVDDNPSTQPQIANSLEAKEKSVHSCPSLPILVNMSVVSSEESSKSDSSSSLRVENSQHIPFGNNILSTNSISSDKSENFDLSSILKTNRPTHPNDNVSSIKKNITNLPKTNIRPQQLLQLKRKLLLPIQLQQRIRNASQRRRQPHSPIPR